MSIVGKFFLVIRLIWPIENRQLWDGKRPRKVFLWREQGIGDDIIFLGLVPEAYERTKRYVCLY